MALKTKKTYYVEDSESDSFGKLVFLNSDGYWRNHLEERVQADFDRDTLKLREEVLVPHRKNCSQGIERFLTEQSCQGFFHFEDVSKLQNIFSEGYIASRRLATEKGWQTAETMGEIAGYNHLVSEKKQRHVQDYARFNIQADNPVLYNWEGYSEGQTIAQPCVLRVNPKIATVKGVRFSKTNANTSGQRYGFDDDFLKEIPVFRLQNIWGCSTHDRGAELLYPVAAPVNFIEEINFRSKGEMKFAKKLTPGWFWHKVMGINRQRFTLSGVTYLANAIVSDRNPDFSEDVEDQTGFSLASKINFYYRIIDPKYGTRVSIFHEGVFAGGNTIKGTELNNWNLKPAINKCGNYEVQLHLVDGNKEVLIYKSNFEVK